MSTLMNPRTESLEQRVRDEVNALRGRFHVSQARLGMVLGITQTQVSQRLRGGIGFQLTEVEALADFFGTTPAYLMGYENAPRPVGPDGGLGCAIGDSNAEPAGSRFAQVTYLWRSLTGDRLAA